MVQPLTQSVFQPTDFDRFLDEVGLGDLTGKARFDLIDKLRDAVHYGIVTKISRRLSSEDQIKLAELMDKADETGNEAEVNAFLFDKIPDIEALVDETIDQVKDQLRFSTGNLNELIESQLAFLQRTQAAGADREINEQFNAPDIRAPFDPASPASLPIPDPIDTDQEPLPPLPPTPLEATRQQLANTPNTEPVSLNSTSTTSKAAKPADQEEDFVDAPEVASLGIPEALAVPPGPNMAAAAGSPVDPALPLPPTPTSSTAMSDSEAAINEELDSLDNIKLSPPPAPNF